MWLFRSRVCAPVSPTAVLALRPRRAVRGLQLLPCLQREEEAAALGIAPGQPRHSQSPPSGSCRHTCRPGSGTAPTGLQGFCSLGAGSRSTLAASSLSISSQIPSLFSPLFQGLTTLRPKALGCCLRVHCHAQSLGPLCSLGPLPGQPVCFLMDMKISIITRTEMLTITSHIY